MKKGPTCRENVGPYVLQKGGCGRQVALVVACSRDANAYPGNGGSVRSACRAATCAVVLAVLCPAGAEAQASPLEPGVWLIGGTGWIYESHDIDDDSRRFVVDLNPQLGYFVLPHLAVHANLGFAYSSTTGGFSRSFAVGPGLSYYFGGPRARVLPYLTARTLFVRSRSGPPDDPSSVSNFRQWLAGGGLSWLVSRNAGLTAEAFYQRSVLDQLAREGGDNDAELYGLRLGVTVFAY
jgi:hypothetical protein